MADEPASARLDLSVVIPALNEGPNLALLLPEIRSVLVALNIGWEILIVTRNPDRQTRQAAEAAGALVSSRRSAATAARCLPLSPGPVAATS